MKKTGKIVPIISEGCKSEKRDRSCLLRLACKQTHYPEMSIAASVSSQARSASTTPVPGIKPATASTTSTRLYVSVESCAIYKESTNPKTEHKADSGAGNNALPNESTTGR